MKDESTLLDALATAGASGLNRTAISYDVFDRNRTKRQIDALVGDLVGRGIVETWKGRENGRRGPDVEWVRIISYDRLKTEKKMSEDWAPPENEGWVRWADVVYIAQAGVPRGYAKRQGKRVRQRRAEEGKVTRTKKKPRLSEEERAAAERSDEQYGVRHIAGEALRSAVRHGSIERRGDWCRLLHDPTRTQRPWMEAAYSILGKAHPTLTGEYTPKPPKTLVSVKESELGRRLLPEEFVKREAGYAGTWDPDHIEIRVRLPHTSSVAELEEAIAAYRQRVAEAPRIVEPRPFEVNLPKKRR